MSTPVSHVLISRRFSVDGEAPPPRSIIRIRLQDPIAGPGSIISASAVSGATQGTYHNAIVRYALPDYDRGCISISVWPVPSYSARRQGPTANTASLSDNEWMSQMPQSFRDTNIPFPSDADTVTPAAFGQPLSAYGFLDRRASWVLMEKQSFDLPFTKAWKRYDPLVFIQVEDMPRIEAYARLLTNPPRPGPTSAHVSMLFLPERSSTEEELFRRMFGTPLRLSSEASGSECSDADGDGFDFLRLVAPRSRVVKEVVEQRDREAAMVVKRNVELWIMESA